VLSHRLHPTLWLALWLTLGASVAHAQLPPEALRFESVLTGGSVHWYHDLQQDSTGFLWAGTWSGLLRYDGYETTRYTTDPNVPDALPSNFVHRVVPAPDGQLWLALDTEIGRFDPVAGTYETVLAAPQANIAANGQGVLWALVRDPGQTFESVRLLTGVQAGREVLRVPTRTVPSGGMSGVYEHLVADDAGNMWVPAGSDGLARAAPQPDTTHAMTRWPAETFGAEHVRSIRRGSDGALWVLTTGGLFRHRAHADDFALVLPAERFPGDLHRTGDWLVDRQGLLWIVNAEDEGLLVIDPATAEHVRLASRVDDPTSLPGAAVTDLYEDRSGVIWVGTMDGLYKAAPHWEHFQTYLLPTSDITATLDAGRDGQLWVGSICTPTYRFDLARGTFTDAEAILPGFDAPACPMRILEDRGGRLWFGTFSIDGRNEGVVRYDPATQTTRRYQRDPDDPASIRSQRFRDLLQDRRGRIWVAGEQGVDRYDPVTDGFVHYAHDPDRDGTLGPGAVWSLAETADGAIWAGAGGLNRIDPETGRVTYFPAAPDDPAAIPSPSVTWIHPSRREPGILWLATYDGGLARFDPAIGRVQRYTEADGLPDLYVKAVLEDERGRIWAPTDRGLARLDPGTDAIRVFTEADGLRSSTLGLYDAVALPDGRFALAHADALVVFHPDSLDAPRTDAEIALTSFRVFDREVPVAAQPEAIRLSHADDFFSFEFAALDFAAPERTRYAYRLEGFAPGWIENGTRRYAAYTSLPPGHYTFRVRANLGGSWSERELAVPVVIAPAWWQTAWFRTLTGLLVLGALVGLVRFASTRRLRRQLRRLEVEQRLQAERERISQDLHDHVGAQLSTIISGIDLARLAGGDGGAPHDDPLDRIETRARQTMAQLRETIWALHREAVTLGAFRERVCTYAREQTALRVDAPDIHCTLDANTSERTLSPAQTLHLYRIAQEALQNALEHAGASRIGVHLRLESDTLTLEVADDGCFGEGEDGEASFGADLNGYGLGGMRRRAEALGARFELDTALGTRVRVVVPLGADPP
jgi:signal transduction histidine kinase/ligand-binding sensor domain-containing protein